MKKITIGCKLGEELYRTGHRRALQTLRYSKTSGYPYGRRQQHTEWLTRPEAVPFIIAQYGTTEPGYTDWDLLADMYNLATWNNESADTTAQRVKRIMQQANA